MNTKLMEAYERASGNTVREGHAFGSGGHLVVEGFTDADARDYLLEAYGEHLDEIVLDEKASEASDLINCGYDECLDYLRSRGWSEVDVLLQMAQHGREEAPCTS
jgi:hypothetical protein